MLSKLKPIEKYNLRLMLILIMIIIIILMSTVHGNVNFNNQYLRVAGKVC